MRIDYNKHVNISALLGKTLTDISVNDDNDEIVFKCSDGTNYLMYHEQDCCESVMIEDVCGNWEDLIGSPILMAEDISNECCNEPRIGYDESYTWTWYKFATVRGYVTVRWYGESNGYYSEDVDFGILKGEKE